MLPIAMTIEQVCETLGCKRTRVFQLLRNGTLVRAQRFGRQIRILTESVESALRGPQTHAPKKRVQNSNVIPIPNRVNIKW